MRRSCLNACRLRLTLITIPHSLRLSSFCSGRRCLQCFLRCGNSLRRSGSGLRLSRLLNNGGCFRFSLLRGRSLRLSSLCGRRLGLPNLCGRRLGLSLHGSSSSCLRRPPSCRLRLTLLLCFLRRRSGLLLGKRRFNRFSLGSSGLRLSLLAAGCLGWSGFSDRRLRLSLLSSSRLRLSLLRSSCLGSSHLLGSCCRLPCLLVVRFLGSS